MSGDSTFRDYVLDADHMQWYSEYQQKYAVTVRESDKVLIELVRAAAAAAPRGKPLRVLDIGCSTGNLLRHMHRALPELQLVGGDMAPDVIAGCKSNPELAGIEFVEMNMLELDRGSPFDMVVANAALMFFTPAEFAAAVASLAGALTPGGAFIVFDLFHPFEQELEIKETTTLHPRGLVLHFRSYRAVREAYRQAGLAPPSFAPFYLPIDLPMPGDPADVTSYTVSDHAGRRLPFRGSLFQPWCHIRSSRQP